MPHETPYRRFMILGAARTGSNMLVSMLNSHPEIVCFREVFNFVQPFVDFAVEGYNDNDPEELALRERDAQSFLWTRIFGEHAPGTRAVGFKLHYPHGLGYHGLVPRLAADPELAVVHLQRRNQLRTLVSQRIAEATGRWFESRDAEAARLAGRPRPIRFADALWRRIRGSGSPARPAARIRLSIEEVTEHFLRTDITIGHFDKLFEGHPMMTMRYEDVTSADEESYRLQEWLGVTPMPLRAAIRRQNPQPLRELITNYDELRRAFAHTAQLAFFDD